MIHPQAEREVAAKQLIEMNINVSTQQKAWRNVWHILSEMANLK